MRKWKRTTLKWDCHLGMDTDIPIDDLHEENKKIFHNLHTMKAVSQEYQKGLLTIRIRRLSVSPTTQRANILQRLKIIAADLYDSRREIFQNLYVEAKDDLGDTYNFGFTSRDQAGFCDASIILAIAIHKGLGIKGPLEFRVSDFTITQETMVWLDEGWITFANWLRMRHGLRIVPK